VSPLPPPTPPPHLEPTRIPEISPRYKHKDYPHPLPQIISPAVFRQNKRNRQRNRIVQVIISPQKKTPFYFEDNINIVEEILRYKTCGDLTIEDEYCSNFFHRFSCGIPICTI